MFYLTITGAIVFAVVLAHILAWVIPPILPIYLSMTNQPKGICHEHRLQG